MRCPERIDNFCEELKSLWKEKAPDMRFGQIIENVKSINNIEDLFYIEEDRMLKLFEDYFGRL